MKLLAAEIYGKVSASRPAHDRMEDVLTSYVLSLFRYLDNYDVLTGFFRKAVNLAGDTLDWAPVGHPSVYFWPRFQFPGTGSREPDAVIIADQEDSARTALIIEVKYRSGLSNVSGVEDEDIVEDADEMRLGLQLADEYCGLKCGKWWSEDLGKMLAPAERRQLVYITGNYILPADDIKQAAEAVQKRRDSRSCGCYQPEKDLFWLSWRDLAPLIDDHITASGRCEYTPGERNLLQDLKEVLDVRDLLPFYPFHDLNPAEPYVSFFRTFFWSLLVTPGKYKSFFRG